MESCQAVRSHQLTRLQAIGEKRGNLPDHSTAHRADKGIPQPADSALPLVMLCVQTFYSILICTEFYLLDIGLITAYIDDYIKTVVSPVP